MQVKTWPLTPVREQAAHPPHCAPGAHAKATVSTARHHCHDPAKPLSRRFQAVRQPLDSWRTIIKQAIAGLALTSLFGAAAGARYGLGSVLLHAAGVPLPYVATTAILIPSFFVACAHSDVDLSPRQVAQCAARALQQVGRLSAGLAPAALMLSVTAERNSSVAWLVGLGLASCAMVMLRTLLHGLDTTESGDQHFRRRCLLTLFGLVATVTTIRIWSMSLPLLGGA